MFFSTMRDEKRRFEKTKVDATKGKSRCHLGARVIGHKRGGIVSKQGYN